MGILERVYDPASEVFMARMMADKDFRQGQWAHRFDEHIAPFNQFVDEIRQLKDRGWAPYIAPMYGGVSAKLLTLLRDPGPATQDHIGSGFLCMENDDPTAEAMDNFFRQVGISAKDIVPWNAYPWYINNAPNVSQRNFGVEPLKGIIDLLPNLQVVMLHGGTAKDSWKRLERKYPHLVSERGLHVISTYHTSRQAFFHPDPKERERRRQHLRDAFQEAARILHPS